MGGERIIDLGGTPHFWRNFPHKVHVTVVNLPGSFDPSQADGLDNVVCLAGNACNMSNFEDKSFDICFSNSVIEHVGGPPNERAFAGEARRLSERYWVQTPSIWFPVEAHTYVPFWWFLPAPVKRFLRNRWSRILPEWNEMIEGTTVILYKDFARMFPDAEIWTERFLLLPKSYVAFRKQ
ncbi:hypothetical protein ROLI_045790 (plasmid) [Roseobacter fucihabitans]|uniref:Methyltransferase type 11 domain-containing protein n=2 Tax=Roseobacter fucihabitans TaxID=1537242 RepID=A0ABZ2C2F4_9RHOB|nr:hypothetical protein [Roseobacter litoralis]